MHVAQTRWGSRSGYLLPLERRTIILCTIYKPVQYRYIARDTHNPDLGPSTECIMVKFFYFGIIRDSHCKLFILTRQRPHVIQIF